MKKHIVLILVLLFSSVEAKAQFNYSRQITINSATFNPATQTNFPVLFCANGAAPCNTPIAGWNQSGSGAHVLNASGFDIRPYGDSTCSTSPMTYQMSNYVASTGEVEMWVLISSLPTSNFTFYLCYGNSSLTTDGSSASTWNSNFVGVWH